MADNIIYVQQLCGFLFSRQSVNISDIAGRAEANACSIKPLITYTSSTIFHYSVTGLREHVSREYITPYIQQSPSGTTFSTVSFSDCVLHHTLSGRNIEELARCKSIIDFYENEILCCLRLYSITYLDIFVWASIHPNNLRERLVSEYVINEDKLGYLMLHFNAIYILYHNFCKWLTQGLY